MSTEKLEQTLGIPCPAALKPIYDAFNAGLLDEVSLDISAQVRHWACSEPFHLFRHDYDQSGNTAVYQASSDKAVFWVFACSPGIHNDTPYLCVNAEDEVFLYHFGSYTQLAVALSDLLEVDFARIKDGRLELTGKHPAPTIEEVVGAEFFFCGDGECIDDPVDYRGFIERGLAGITGGLLSLGQFKSATNGAGETCLSLTLNGRSFEMTLPDQHGWVELGIIDQFNVILDDLDCTPKRFMAVRDPDWGQELGVVFAENEQLQMLKMLLYSCDGSANRR